MCALKSGTYNETHFDNAEVRRPDRRRPSRRSTRPSAPTLLQDAQEIEYNEGGYIIWGFRRQVDGYSGKVVQGIKPSRTSRSGSYKFQYASVSA